MPSENGKRKQSSRQRTKPRKVQSKKKIKDSKKRKPIDSNMARKKTRS